VADGAPAWMAAASPGWVAANLFQALWCAAFRPWARPLAAFWLTPVLLGSVALSLSFSQVREQPIAPSLPPHSRLTAGVLHCNRMAHRQPSRRLEKVSGPILRTAGSTRSLHHGVWWGVALTVVVGEFPASHTHSAVRLKACVPLHRWNAGNIKGRAGHVLS
jgi:hypothetical protein